MKITPLLLSICTLSLCVTPILRALKIISIILSTGNVHKKLAFNCYFTFLPDQFALSELEEELQINSDSDYQKCVYLIPPTQDFQH